MIALISPAKTMLSRAALGSQAEGLTEPRFLEHTEHIISEMLRYNRAELSSIFRISPSIAAELKVRFDALCDHSTPTIAAVESYDGVVFKHFKEEVDRDYLERHLRISSLLYGLLRPFDAIRPYRMEGFVRLASSDERVDRSWREIQTQTLIDDVESAGGTLIYLASKEEQSAFDWKRVKRSVRVIDIEFLQHKGDKLRQVVIYTKMARGEMIRHMNREKIESCEDLKSFEWSGYSYRPELSTPDKWVWVMD